MLEEEFSVAPLYPPTVMNRFSARGAYLLLVPQGRALICDRALFRERAHMLFEEKPNV